MISNRIVLLALEGILKLIKAYWENSWSSEKTYPLGIFNTNHDRMEEWSKTRVRRLDFLVKFKGTSDEQIRLQGLLERQNLVFPAFSKIYSTIFHRVQNIAWTN